MKKASQQRSVIGRLAEGTNWLSLFGRRAPEELCVPGWNLTGDAYEMDADGCFHYRARTDDMIITAGYNVAGPEVEEVLLKHADVAECCGRFAR